MSISLRALVLLLALIAIVPWQGALDRIGDAAGIAPVPAAKGYTEDALAILGSGAWWRVEPDYSLFLVRNVEFAHRNTGRWRIATAYGPWSFLFRGYHPSNYVPLVVAWSGIAILSVLLALKATESVGITAAMLIAIAINPRPVLLLVLPLLVLLAYWREKERPLSPLIIVSIVAMGMIALVKSSSLAVAAIVAAAIGIDEVLRRRLPLAPVLFAASILAFWLVAGQDLRWFPGFLVATWHVSATYGEAEFAGAMTVASLLLPLGGMIAVIQEVRRRTHIVTVLAIAAIVLAFIKTALVRNDMFHAELAPAVAAVLIAIYARDTATWVPSKKRLITAALVICAMAIVLPFLPPPIEFQRQLAAAVNPPAAKRASDRLYASDLAAIAARTPLPRITSTVDMYGERQSLVIAHDLAYQPRPIYQSYIAYDGYLTSLNASHLREARAPIHILFSMARSDERFPSLDDGLSWPELLTRYRVAAVSSEIALFQKVATPGTWRITPCATLHARLGERVAIPSTCRGLVWTKIAVHRTLIGALTSIIYKVPEITLTASTRGGEQLGGRMIRRIASAGFLLSPVIVGPVDFAAVANGQAGTLAARVVDAVVVDSENHGAYRQTFDVELYELTLQR